MAHDPIRKAYGQRRHLNNIYTTVCATIVTLEHQAKILRTFAEKTLADMAEIEARYGLHPLPTSTGAVIPDDMPFLADQKGHSFNVPESLLRKIVDEEGNPPFDNRPVKE